VFGGTSFEAPAALPDNAGDRDAQQEVAEEAGLDDLREVLTAAASIGDRERDAIAIHLRELLPWVAQQNFEALPSVVSYESNEAESAESAAGTLPQGAGASTVVGNGNLVHDQTTSR
jgi:hypothetical protein